jgi:hypothetical protein
MRYSTKYGRQKRKDTGIIVSKRVLFCEAGFTNATVVDDAIRFVSSKSKENVKPYSEDDKEESNEPDYEEEKDRLEEEQEEETGEITTTNQIF